jgi:hypothetical protein
MGLNKNLRQAGSENGLDDVQAEPSDWKVNFHPDFLSGEFEQMDSEQRKALLAAALALQVLGPRGGRPLIDTLRQSRHKNMKELRYEAHRGAEIWRAAFAFDPLRRAIVLVAGDKQGVSKKMFYQRLIEKADQRLITT